MAREETCILTNMCMIYEGNRILAENYHWLENDQWKVKNI